jgi:uncharacterized membrane protein YecN with MAPEG domain
MEMPSLLLVSITPIYAALLGLLFVPFTFRVGLYRVGNKINLGDGNDPELLKRIRGQGNFVETVPLALILLILMEVMGASNTWLHALGAALVIGRVLHYLGVTETGPFIGRPVGMFATMAVYLVASVWILVKLFY